MSSLTIICCIISHVSKVKVVIVLYVDRSVNDAGALGS